jgi:plastocyanin
MHAVRRLGLFTGAISAVLALSVGQIGIASASSGPMVEIVGFTDLGSPSGQPFDFKQGRIVVHSGETVTWRNESPEPHSISIVTPADVPATLSEMDNCATCDRFLGVHAPTIGPNGPQPPFVAAVDDFRASNAQPSRLDAPGDSIIVAEQGSAYPSTSGGTIGDSASAVVTAPRGTTLTYFCALHPWMQGIIEVR